MPPKTTLPNGMWELRRRRGSNVAFQTITVWVVAGKPHSMRSGTHFQPISWAYLSENYNLEKAKKV